MTGGRVYVRHNPAWNLDREAIARRLGEGAKVHLTEIDAEGEPTGQPEEAERMLELALNAVEHFLVIVPEKVQADPNISTE
jgi:glutamate synthase (NADPH/NADH) large chain